MRLLILVLSVALLSGCKKADRTSGTTAASTPEASAPGLPDATSGCDHDQRTNVTLPHTWPYPADAREIRWTDGREKTGLKIKPRGVAFRTATVTWKKGQDMGASDSQVVVTKPRRLVAKRDMQVRREIWDQGRRVEATAGEIKKGDVVSFLFFDSRGSCLVRFGGGTGSVPCTLEDSFEGLSAEHPFACEQVWWVKVRRAKRSKGWLVFDEELMERVDAAPTR